MGHGGCTLQRAAETWRNHYCELYSNQLLIVNKKLQDLMPYSGHSARKIISNAADDVLYRCELVMELEGDVLENFK